MVGDSCVYWIARRAKGRVRVALNATLGGVVRMLYPKFVFWSSISGALWSALTCALSTALITGIIWLQNRRSSRRHAAG